MLYGILTLVVLLVAAEVTLRLKWGLCTPVLYRSDPACAYLPVSDQDVHRFGRHIAINQFGMRSDSISPDKPAGTLRVMLLGDSVIFGGAVTDQSELAATLLGPRLSADLSRRVEVLNASTGGWAVGNELGYLRSRGIFDADVVVFFLNTIDLTQPYEPDISGSDSYPSRAPVCALKELVVHYAIPRLFHRGSASDPGATETDVIDPRYPQLVFDELSQAQSFVEQAHGTLGVVLSPTQPVSAASGERDRRDESQLAAWAGQHHVAYMDLTDVYRQRPVERVYRDAVHLNASGQRLVADTLEPWLIKLMKEPGERLPAHAASSAVGTPAPE